MKTECKPKFRKDVIFIVFDALRYDVFSSLDEADLLVPNMAKIARKNGLNKIVSNGHTTRFAFPSLFTQTYPLDYDGYNFGISRRPSSIVESLKEKGYFSKLIFGAELDIPMMGFDRGADEVIAAYDKLLPIYMFLRYYLHYEVSMWKKGRYSDGKIKEILFRDYDTLLNFLSLSKNRTQDPFLHRRARNYTVSEVNALNNERALLKKDFRLICEKILTIPLEYYYLALGRKTLPKYFFLYRVKSYFLGKIQYLMNNRLGFNINCTRTTIPIFAKDYYKEVIKSIKNSKKPWFIFWHIEDLHDYRIVLRPLSFFRKCLLIPHCLKIRRKINSKRALFYDLTLIHLDRMIKGLISEINKYDNEALIFITSDHGYGWKWERSYDQTVEFGFRTHREHINVPLLIHGGMNKYKGEMLDTINIGDLLFFELGFIDLLNIDVDDFVITESAGRNNCDLENNDLFFTVTGKDLKIMVHIQKDKIIVEKIFDIANDPEELNNIVNKDLKERIKKLLDFLFVKRAKILSFRKVKRENIIYKDN